MDPLILAILGPELELLKVQGSHVTVKVLSPMITSDRGHLLLETEKHLRAEWNPKAEVFLEPMGDINKLRLKLRGVKV